MKVLIVNAFKSKSSKTDPSSPYRVNTVGCKKFQSFVTLVKNAFSKHKYTVAGSYSIVTVDLNSLQDYLNPQVFDTVDFVFMDGDSNYLPWNKRCEKLYELFKLCKLTNK